MRYIRHSEFAMIYEHFIMVQVVEFVIISEP